MPPACASSSPRLLAAARALHAYLLAHHVHGGQLAGADQGVRWNIRIWRFVKSYLPFLRPRERYYFLQGQAYLAFASWTLGDLTGELAYHEAARAATRVIRDTQRADGAWAYPLPERRHLVATVEGDFGAVAMLDAFERDGDRAWLDSALRWHAYLEREIGYQQHPSGLCVNYFQKPRGMVPNNTCEWIWVLGRFASATGDSAYRANIPALLGFLEAVMLPSGELPYELAGPHESRTQLHYLCYQYNAFQCMKLAWYAHQHDDARARALAVRLADYLATGVLPSGAVRASCLSVQPEVLYYADAVGMALRTVSAFGWADHHEAADRAFRFVLSHQRPDGGLDYFSRGDYGVLSDRNEYPRYLAMSMYHLSERARDARVL
ncbi:MAG: hypothetical protein ABIU54_06180 [Candidatus Eisenbacteria bacterium]